MTIPCIRCGQCCLNSFLTYVHEEDLQRWKNEKRDDILRFIDSEHAFWAGDRLISNIDGHTINGCSFLVRYYDFCTCLIYDTRPAVCRKFEPGSSEFCSQFDGDLT
jgi:Fe-S-cluster containining protein